MGNRPGEWLRLVWADEAKLHVMPRIGRFELLGCPVDDAPSMPSFTTGNSQNPIELELGEQRAAVHVCTIRALL